MRAIARTSVICLLFAAGSSVTAETPDVSALLEPVGFSRGVCCLPACDSSDLAVEIARQTSFLVHAFGGDRVGMQRAAEHCRQNGWGPDRIRFEWLTPDRLPYADNFVDLVVMVPAAARYRPEEVARVVRPRGCVLIQGGDQLAASLAERGFQVGRVAAGWQLARKPVDPAVDDWSHWYHQPDNNPVSHDAVIRAPYLTQWLGAPYYHAMPVVSTAAGGRVFIASGHIAHHDRETPTLNTLVARNGYNGRVLWERSLPDGYLVHRSAFIATDRVFYLMARAGVLCLNPETGEEVARLDMPELDGTLMWMALQDDTLYVLAGDQDPPAETLQVHSQGRGWGWDQVDRNYSPDGKHQIRWGFGHVLAAYNLKKRTVEWKCEQPNIDSRGIGILGDRLFYYVPGTMLACLNRATGERIWTNEDRQRLSLIEDEARGLPGTPGFRTSCMVLATPVGLFIQGQKRMNVVGFALDDGHFLWSKRKFHNNPNMLYTDGKLYISGIERNGSVQVIDPRTGASLEDLSFWKVSCARLTGSPEALYCRGEGLGRYDLDSGIYTTERTARPGCNDGAIPANGLLYVGPWLCDCNLSILGQLVLGPAGGFDAQAQTLSDEHLDAVAALGADDALAVDARDWPAYRANNRRTASTSARVPDTARRLWRREPGSRGARQAPAVAAAGRVFAAGDDGLVCCLDAATGAELWHFATGGPVLASPTLWQGRVFVGSGDGYVYCLAADDGQLLWRFRAAPIERRIAVYGDLASTWPVNSGVLVHNGVAFAAAGIMFRDGTHVVALDARTGKLKWHNGLTGKPINEQYELYAASALGTLAIGQDRLWLAAGNVITPVSFDLETGQSSMLAAQREPKWNAVMVQTPEPAGRDLMVFADRFLLHGGRLLYSGEGPVVSSAQVNFRGIGPQGQILGPAFTPVRSCAVSPAWDDQLFVMGTARYGDLLAWDRPEVETRLASTLQVMTKMDADIPGDSPEKWGQYNLIGRVFATVERQLRMTSKWPVVREEVFALAVAGNAVIVTGRSRNPQAPCYTAAYTRADRREIWKVDLPVPPRLGGLSIDRDGRALVTLQDGSLLCVGN